MKVFGIAGWSGSGKTTLLMRLIPALTRRGVDVATLKHTHHSPVVGTAEDRALAAAGATETVTASPRRFVLIRELGEAPEPTPEALVRHFDGIDLLLVEGFKWASWPKLQIWPPSTDEAMPSPELLPSVVAVAADQPVATSGLPCFRRDDIDGIADFVAEYCRR